MTLTEVVVVVGGLVLGYWIVAVFLPLLGRKSDDSDDSGACRPEQDALDGGDGAGDSDRDAPGDAGPPDGPPVRREM